MYATGKSCLRSLPAWRSPARSPRIPLTSGRRRHALGQKSIGGSKNITHWPRYYSFNWWLNTTDRENRRLYAALPADVFAAVGHGGQKTLWVIPSFDLVVRWNTDRVKDRPEPG
jgi:hypothetical protein